MREETKRTPQGASAKDGRKSERVSTICEAGEPSQGTPSRKGTRRVTERLEGKTAELEALMSVSTKLELIAARAREHPQEVITNVNHFIDVAWLKEAHERTRKDRASGIDGVTAKEYAVNLDENLAVLLERFKTRTYRAPPVRRVHIPKGDGSKTRPIGIPTFEDKILQRAVAMLLEAVYEQQFRNCSYGYRPRRSCHGAIDALRGRLMKTHGGFVVELDIQSFFDSLDHGHLRSFLDLRVRDGVIRRAIGCWLKAGVLEDGRLERPDNGTPQGGVISPILANIFLHHVLDVWFEDEIAPRLSGEALLVRYADDVVIVIDTEEDARRVMAVLPKRFGRFGLTLHPEKTGLVRFKRPRFDSKGRGRDDDDEQPGSFNFLGFTHFWGGTRNGGRAIMQTTDTKKERRTIKELWNWCKTHRHWSIRDQHRKLCEKLIGHYGFYGVPGNSRALSRVRNWTARAWRNWLNRRSQRVSMTWERFKLLLQRYPLPVPLVARRYRCAAKP